MCTLAAFNRVNTLILSYWLRPLRARVREYQTLFRPIFKVLFPHILDCLLKAMTDRVAGYTILRPCARREVVDALFVLIRAPSKTISLKHCLHPHPLNKVAGFSQLCKKNKMKWNENTGERGEVGSGVVTHKRWHLNIHQKSSLYGSVQP